MPKNGVIPLGKYVKFRVKSFGPTAKFIRVFLIYCKDTEDLEVKKELFKQRNLEYDLETQPFLDEEEDEDSEYFERYIKIVSSEVSIVAELEENHDFEILAEFQAEEYDDNYFSGIDKNWLDFLKKDYYYIEPHIKPQLTVATHPLSLVLKIDEKFKNFEKNVNFKKMKNAKLYLTPESIVNLICQEHDKFLDQIIFIYLWITKSIEYLESRDLLAGILNRNPRQVCKSLKGNSRSISGLFWRCIQLLKKESKEAESDLECIIVDGFLKQEDQIGYTKSNHSWNLVKFNKFWYNIDCSKACFSKSNFSKFMDIDHEMSNNKALYTEEEMMNLRRYFFFTKPEILLMTHFPEEKFYSLYQDYFFSFEKFMAVPIYYPKLFVSKIFPITKLKFNGNIHDVYKLEFRSDQFYHKFTLDKILESNAILQKCHFDLQDSYLYTVYIFEFGEFGNKNFTICLEEVMERKIKKKQNYGIKAFFEGSIKALKKRGIKLNKAERIVTRPLINFNLQVKGTNPIFGKEEYFIPPQFLLMDQGLDFLNNRSVSPTTPQIQKLSSYRGNLGSNESSISKKRSSIGDHLQYMNSQRNPLMHSISPSSKTGNNNSMSSLNSQNISANYYFKFLKVLSPGCYFLPEKKNILFYVFWKYREGLILDGVRGEISVQKVSEDIFEFNGKFEPGFVYLRTEEGLNLVEFKVVKEEEFPQQLYGVVELN